MAAVLKAAGSTPERVVKTTVRYLARLEFRLHREPFLEPILTMKLLLINPFATLSLPINYALPPPISFIIKTGLPEEHVRFCTHERRLRDLLRIHAP